jgi:hypothetical protein
MNDNCKKNPSVEFLDMLYSGPELLEGVAPSKEKSRKEPQLVQGPPESWNAERVKY